MLKYYLPSKWRGLVKNYLFPFSRFDKRQSAALNVTTQHVNVNNNVLKIGRKETLDTNTHSNIKSFS